MRIGAGGGGGGGRGGSPVIRARFDTRGGAEPGGEEGKGRDI